MKQMRQKDIKLNKEETIQLKRKQILNQKENYQKQLLQEWHHLKMMEQALLESTKQMKLRNQQQQLNKQELKLHDIRTKLRNLMQIMEQQKFRSSKLKRNKIKKPSQIFCKVQKSVIKYSAILKQNQQKLSQEPIKKKFSQKNSKEEWRQLEKIIDQQQDSDFVTIACLEVIDKQLNEQQKDQDLAIKKQIKLKCQTQPKQSKSIYSVLDILRSSLQAKGHQVVFSQKSNLRSQLSLKALSTGFLSNQVRCLRKFQDGETKWDFDQIASSELERIKFQNYFRKLVSKQLNIDGDQITIHSLVKGSIQVLFTTSQSITDPSPKYKTLHFFKTFNLSKQMFDKRGDITFSDSKSTIEKRGGWPYYQPVKCKRFGLNVLGKYDNGNNNWLSMKGVRGQWAVAFHGVRDPSKKSPQSNIAVLNSIMSGANSTAYLKVGPKQAYRNDDIKNTTNLKVGEGIYCTPHIRQTYRYTSSNDQFKVIFQCRVNPSYIRVCAKNNKYWVIKQSQNIRPYGIILIQQNKFHPTALQQFNEEFSYQKHRNSIQNSNTH